MPRIPPRHAGRVGGRQKGTRNKSPIRTDMKVTTDVHVAMVKNAKLLAVSQAQYQRQALAHLTRLYATDPPEVPPEKCEACGRGFAVFKRKPGTPLTRLTVNLDGDSVAMLTWLATNFFHYNASAAMEKALVVYAEGV